LIVAWAAVVAAGCEATGEASAPEARASATAAVAAAKPSEVVFDPNNPPPGWKLCHRNHCHHEDGRVASYAQVMQEIGATSMVGGQAAPVAPPAPPDVATIPLDADKSQTGLVSRQLKPGTGKRKPTPTSVVTVHYTGWTTDGKAFDSSVARGQPAQFPLNRMMPGWIEGIQLMVEGEERRLWVPEALAYKGAANKPKGTLVFDMELVSIRD
jgi:peptidylprolyl isomerase